MNINGRPYRSRTREDLARECARILDCDTCDENSVMNSADRLADLLHELTNNTGLMPVEGDESYAERQRRIWM